MTGLDAVVDLMMLRNKSDPAALHEIRLDYRYLKSYLINLNACSRDYERPMDPLQTAGASQPHQPPHSSHAQHHRNARRCAATTSLNPTTSIFLPTPKRPSRTAVPANYELPPSRRDQLASHAKRVSQQPSSPNPAVPASPYHKRLTLIFPVAESSPSKCRPKVSYAKTLPARRAPSAEPPTT